MNREELTQRLHKVEEEISEVMQRLPAHSVKPPVMMELLELEDQRDALKEQINVITD